MQEFVSIRLHSRAAYAIMLSMERKAQASVLFHSASRMPFGKYLERAKNVMSSSRGDGVSTSDVAKDVAGIGQG